MRTSSRGSTRVCPRSRSTPSSNTRTADVSAQDHGAGENAVGRGTPLHEPVGGASPRALRGRPSPASPWRPHGVLCSTDDQRPRPRVDLRSRGSGFAIIYKSTSVVNFAQGEFLMFGAYFCFSMVVQFKVPWIWAFLLTLVFSIVLALLVERLILRPMIGEPVISIIMVTIGLSSVLRSIVMAVWGTEIRVYDPPPFPDTAVNIARHPDQPGLPVELALSIGLLVLFGLFFKYSKAGVAMRATAFSNQVALSMGIGVKNIFALAWWHRGSGLGHRRNLDRQHQWHQQRTRALWAQGVFRAVILAGLDSIIEPRSAGSSSAFSRISPTAS